MGNRFAYAVTALVCGVTVNAGAQVYRCTTPSGGTEYSQVPCSKDAQLLQNKENSIDRGPIGDPFGVKRERERQQAETEGLMRKYYENAKKPLPQPSASVRQIDSAACERADRDAHIESRHAREDAAAIRRKQKLADWECGRDIAVDPITAAPPRAKAPTPQPAAAPPGPAYCDASGCWGDGGRYWRSGTSDTYVSPSGTACMRVGQQLVCP